jgi:hypothetical protein
MFVDNVENTTSKSENEPSLVSESVGESSKVDVAHVGARTLREDQNCYMKKLNCESHFIRPHDDDRLICKFAAMQIFKKLMRPEDSVLLFYFVTEFTYFIFIFKELVKERENTKK